MITFYPGPSKVYPQVADYAVEAVRTGIVSLNHRSAGFMDIVKETIRLLHVKLAIPADYHVALVSSATECWEIVLQSLRTPNYEGSPDIYSAHYYMGAFGEKWFNMDHFGPSSGYGNKNPEPLLNYFYGNEPEDQKAYQNRRNRLAEAEIVCLVQNETSNGSQLNQENLAGIRQIANGLIAVDAVSSMAGIVLDWSLADVWFASVQKCFGLPAGLAVLVYSPAALQRAQAIDERDHYNSLLTIHENFSKFQTPYTPNGLGIYCLMRVLQQVPSIAEVDAITKRRAADWYAFFQEMAQSTGPAGPPVRSRFQLLVNDPAVRSDTVIAVEGSEDDVKAVKTAAQQAGIILGNGYGDWKNTTFRIANFPAITDEEIGRLQQFYASIPRRGVLLR